MWRGRVQAEDWSSDRSSGKLPSNPTGKRETDGGPASQWTGFWEPSLGGGRVVGENTWPEHSKEGSRKIEQIVPDGDAGVEMQPELINQSLGEGGKPLHGSQQQSCQSPSRGHESPDG